MNSRSTDYANFFSLPAEKMAEKHRFAEQLTEHDITKLLDNATPEATKKATKFGMKIFNGRCQLFCIFIFFGNIDSPYCYM